MSEQIFRDPVFDGATDPTVIRDRATGDLRMLFTQRRVTDPAPTVRWVHGTRIGMAVSSDDGATWRYDGVAEGLGHEADTLWAPEVIDVDGVYRMFVTVVDGIWDDWTGHAGIVEYRSDDLRRWRHVQDLDVGADRVIDAAVARTGDGRWRLWYKNESDASSTWALVSDDLASWEVEGRVIPAEPAHEGPNVFVLGGSFWMLTDEWRGLAVHRSPDGIAWTRQEARGGLVLDAPGRDAGDREIGRHADVLVADDGASADVYYFTHPAPPGADAAALRASAVHVARATVQDGVLVVDRDAAPGPR